MSEKPVVQVWEDVVDGRTHRVEVRGSMSREVRWTVDGEEAATRRSTDERLRLESPEHGQVHVRFSTLGAPRRATLFPPSEDSGATAAAVAGVGGTDLAPEPDSRADRFDRRVLAHPRRYAALQTAAAIAKVVLPLVLAGLLARIAFAIPWPDVDLPSIPRPDLPSLPWPDLPSLPAPDLDLPGWVRAVVDALPYVVPVLVALFVARSEIRRRRAQEARRAAGRGEGERTRNDDGDGKDQPRGR